MFECLNDSEAWMLSRSHKESWNKICKAPYLVTLVPKFRNELELCIWVDGSVSSFSSIPNTQLSTRALLVIIGFIIIDIRLQPKTIFLVYSISMNHRK